MRKNNIPSNFDYELDSKFIANNPTNKRDESKLMVVNRNSGEIEHKKFSDIVTYLNKGDVLVVNSSKVFPARLIGVSESGKRIEILLLNSIYKSKNIWEAIYKGKLRIGDRIEFDTNFNCLVIDKKLNERIITIQFDGDDVDNKINSIGKFPLPPYIKSDLKESEIRQRYQTVYAQNVGSSAAPTAGLHFTHELIAKLREKGVIVCDIDLHVGLGTFLPLTEENIKTSSLHSEYYSISKETAHILNSALRHGTRIISVGTTTLRALESSFVDGEVKSGSKTTTAFYYPEHKFNVVNALITNFHLPKSSLLMLVCAFASYPNSNFKFDTFDNSIIGQAYVEAIENNYRFFSFGDASIII